MKFFQTLLLTLTATLSLQAQPAHTEQILTSSGGDAVAMDKEWAVVGDVDNEKVHIFKLDYTKIASDPTHMWVEQQAVIAPNPNNDEQFGKSVAISGKHMLVGSPAKEGSWMMEVGEITVANPKDNITSVTFDKKFGFKPIVILLSTAQGGKRVL